MWSGAWVSWNSIYDYYYSLSKRVLHPVVHVSFGSRAVMYIAFRTSSGLGWSGRLKSNNTTPENYMYKNSPFLKSNHVTSTRGLQDVPQSDCNSKSLKLLSHYKCLVGLIEEHVWYSWIVSLPASLKTQYIFIYLYILFPKRKTCSPKCRKG